MSTPARDTDAPLTYDTATPEQVQHARDEARRKLAEADARWTPECRERARREFLARLDAA